MIHRIHSSMLLASFALAFAGCGGSDDPPDKLSEAFIDLIQRQCDKIFDCKSSYVPAMHEDEPFTDYAGGSTADACANSIKTLALTFNGQDYLAKLDASVAAGRIKYNAKDYDACLTAAEAATCDQVFDQNGATFTPPVVCDTYRMGQVAKGGTCTLSVDCAGADSGCDSTTHTCD